MYECAVEKMTAMIPVKLNELYICTTNEFIVKYTSILTACTFGNNSTSGMFPVSIRERRI